MAASGGSKRTQFKPGQSGNPGGYTKEMRRIVGLAQAKSEEAINTLYKLMKNPKTPYAVRVRSAEILLDRAWGKPKEIVQIEKLDELTDAELETFIAEQEARLRSFGKGRCGGLESEGGKEDRDGGPDDDGGTLH